MSQQRPVEKPAPVPSLIASAPPPRHLPLLVNITVCSISYTVPFIRHLACCASTWLLETESWAEVQFWVFFMESLSVLLLCLSLSNPLCHLLSVGSIWSLWEELFCPLYTVYGLTMNICGRTTSIYSPFIVLSPYNLQVEYDGLTGRVEFNSKGQRTNYTLRILEKHRGGHKEVRSHLQQPGHITVGFGLVGLPSDFTPREPHQVSNVGSRVLFRVDLIGLYCRQIIFL